MMTSTMVNFFLSVVIRKNLTLTLLRLNFILPIYNGEISLKEVEFKQRDLEKK